MMTNLSHPWSRLVRACAAFIAPVFCDAFQYPFFPNQALSPENFATASLRSCPAACELLSTIQPEQVHSYGSLSFERARYGFWDQAQRSTTPECIYQPHSARDVSLAVILARYTACPFGIKSGGHGRFSGETTVEGGLVIDLVNLNQLEVSKDRKTVVLGPGLRWLEVYTALEPFGITVLGGRDSDVGVGGFLLGGGISFLSNQYGWAADSIRSYEIVLANGSITTASVEHNADLYKALRGGGSNFGIVTSFTLESVPYKGMWGGIRANTMSELDDLIDAFMHYGSVSTIEDPLVSVISNMGFHQGAWLFPNDLEYGEPVVNPPSLQGFLNLPATLDETGYNNMSTITIGLTNFSPRGYHNSYWALATKLDARVLMFYVDLFIAEAEKLMAVEPGVNPVACIQVITPRMRRFMSRNGGNVLGLDDSEEPLLLFNPAVRWSGDEDSERIYRFVHDVLHKTKIEATKFGKQHNFLYLNYASQFQDPLGSYGAESLEFMRRVAEKYDSEGVFQKLRASGFKLNGPYTKRDW